MQGLPCGLIPFILLIVMKIAFTGGGTGGHIYPGLAIAAELVQRAGPDVCGIFWIGAKTGMDKSIVEEAGVEFFGIPAGKLRRYFSLKTIPDFFRVIAGFFAARKIFRREKPVLLFSKGGFVSVPPCAAAASLGIPVFTHESDFSPGLATRLNARFARQIFIAYNETTAYLPEKIRHRLVVTGNPVRSGFYKADKAKGRAFLGLTEDQRILLVLGGSLGARELNELVRNNINELCGIYSVAHITGGSGGGEAPAMSGRYKPFPYIREEMPHVLACAELVLGRSGAGTVWECAVMGKPMVLVPLSENSRGDQVENARFFERAGAAICLTGQDLNDENLVRVIDNLARDSKKREAMAYASGKIGRTNGACNIVSALTEFMHHE